MPNKLLTDLSKKNNIPLSKLEKDWEFAVKETEDNFGIKKSNFKDKHYAYVVGIIKNMNKIKEGNIMKAKLNRANETTLAFLKSKKPAKEFFETLGAVAISSDTPDLNKNQVSPNNKTEEDDEENPLVRDNHEGEIVYEDENMSIMDSDLMNMNDVDIDDTEEYDLDSDDDIINYDDVDSYEDSDDIYSDDDIIESDYEIDNDEIEEDDVEFQPEYDVSDIEI